MKKIILPLVFFGMLLASPGLAADYVTQPSVLNGYWSFDGDVEDHSGNGYHGTIDGAVYAQGQINQGMYFDGDNDRVTTDLELDQSDDSNGATLIAWVRADDYPIWKSTGSSAIIDTDGAGYGWSIMLHRYTWGYLNGYSSVFPDEGAATLDEWIHLAVTFERWADDGSAGTSFYINGEKVSTDEDMGYRGGSQKVTFGDSLAYQQNFEGIIDEVYIYNRALTDSEVRSHYTGNIEVSENYVPNKIKKVKIPKKYKKVKRAKVTWNKRANATGYIVELQAYDWGSHTYEKEKTYTINKKVKKKVIKKLTGNTKYRVKVRGVRVVEGLTFKGEWSKPVKFKTKKSSN